MPPDLNSLPASPPTTSATPPAQRPRRISISQANTFRPSPPSPRSPPLSSLQAAATINSGLRRSPSTNSPALTAQGLERRRSSLMNNFTINDPTLPAPGEMQQPNGSPRTSRRSFVMPIADPNHHQQPSLGELHQELENEQEAQVNRLLQMIRIQRQQLDGHEQSPPSTEPQHPPSVSRRLSNLYPNSRGTSPAQRPVSANLGPLPPSEDYVLSSGSRDECAFYQAETQTLARENQMLKLRIRELERQIADMSYSGAPAFINPVHNSPLASPPATFTSEAAPTVSATVAEPTAAKVE